MYLIITTRCNMKCPHCWLDATAEGEDMSWEIFKAALKLNHWSFVLGGGEPTLHPEFSRFLDYALEALDQQGCIQVVTNGTQTQTAMELARLTRLWKRDRYFQAALSYDAAHDLDMVSAEVVEEFRRLDALSNAFIDDEGFYSPPYAQGRALLNYDFLKYECVLPEPVVWPRGEVTFCGCDKSPVIGHVLDEDFDVDDDDEESSCCYWYQEPKPLSLEEIDIFVSEAVGWKGSERT